MLERVRLAPGVRLGAKEYLADFASRFDRFTGFFWKLERLQHFQEPDDGGWKAAMAGDWERSMRLAAEELPALVGHFRRLADHGVESRRVRVVEHSLSPYLQWELHNLKVRVDAGDSIRVLPAERIADLETGQMLPEVVILGTEVLYEVRYDNTGGHAGARRIEDRQLIEGCRSAMLKLFGWGEDLSTFFAREVSPLPPPRSLDPPALLRANDPRRA